MDNLAILILLLGFFVAIYFLYNRIEDDDDEIDVNPTPKKDVLKTNPNIFDSDNGSIASFLNDEEEHVIDDSNEDVDDDDDDNDDDPAKW